MKKRTDDFGAARQVLKRPRRPYRPSQHRESQAVVVFDCRVAGSLMLDLGIELRTEQDHDRGNPHPHHHPDSRAKRAVRYIIVGEAGEIPRQQRGAAKPRDCCEHAANADPLPARLATARGEAVDKRETDYD